MLYVKRFSLFISVCYYFRSLQSFRKSSLVHLLDYLKLFSPNLQILLFGWIDVRRSCIVCFVPHYEKTKQFTFIHVWFQSKTCLSSLSWNFFMEDQYQF